VDQVRLSGWQPTLQSAQETGWQQFELLRSAFAVEKQTVNEQWPDLSVDSLLKGD
jgi:hypothetical protein